MSGPLVSVIIPLHESHRTLGKCLESLKGQTFRDFEVVLVDSSPDRRSAAVSHAVLPSADYVHAGRQLLPQAARNLGAERARGKLFAFTDPDIYPATDWLERLVGAWRERPAVVVGAIACFGRRWLDRGVHLCKFNICLPGGHARPVPLGWSGNLLVERGLFESLGRLDPEHIQGDTVFTARARSAGHEIWFEPRAVVAHDHERLRIADFIGERYRRGHEFATLEAAGHLEADHSNGTRSRCSALHGLLLYPLRVPNRVIHIGRAAAAANLLGDYWCTLPVVLSGVTAWYTGMWVCHWRRLCRRAR